MNRLILAGLAAAALSACSQALKDELAGTAHDPAAASATFEHRCLDLEAGKSVEVYLQTLDSAGAPVDQVRVAWVLAPAVDGVAISVDGEATQTRTEGNLTVDGLAHATVTADARAAEGTLALIAVAADVEPVSAEVRVHKAGAAGSCSAADAGP